MKFLKQKFIILFLIIFLTEPILFAQNKYNLTQLGKESVDYVKRPVRWKGKDWLALGFMVTGTAITYRFDQSVRDVAIHNPGYSNTAWIFAGKQWGGFFFPPALVVGLYTHGCIADNNFTKKMGFEIAQAIIYSEAISLPIKAFVGRPRPLINKGANYFMPFSFFNSSYNSFPAGHVDCAFALSTVLSKNAKCDLLKIAAYVPAAFTVISRIYTNHHWASDCFFGAALGTFTGIWVVNTHKKSESKVQITSLYPLQMKVILN